MHSVKMESWSEPTHTKATSATLKKVRFLLHCTKVALVFSCFVVEVDVVDVFDATKEVS